MKKQIILALMAALLAALCLPLAWSQNLATVKGTVKDDTGKPMADAVVEYLNAENGRKYDLKTNKKGEYYSLGIIPGTYKVTLLKDGKNLFSFDKVPVQLTGEDFILDFDMAKEKARGQQQQQAQMTEEQKKQKEEIEKHNAMVKSLNEKLAQTDAAIKGGNPEQGITTMTEATQALPNEPILWARLADAYVAAGKKVAATDKDTAKKDYQGAVDAYRKALVLKPNDGVYLNNLADAQNRAGLTDDAAKTYQQAIQADPTNAGAYYFNLGAILTNSGKADEAVQAFDKAIEANPQKADAYYWKGVNLIAKATTAPDGKMNAPAGTAEAFNKYLELQPTGTYAQPAKDMLGMIGAKVETGYKETKKKK